MNMRVMVFVLAFFWCGIPNQVFASGTLTQLGILTGETTGGEFAYPNTYYPLKVADVNEDGLDDILVGARYHLPNAGFYIFFGSQNVSDRSAQLADVIIRDDEDIVSGTTAVGEGIGVADTDGDGHLEVLVSNYRHDDVNHDEGAVYFFKAGPSLSSKNTSQNDARIIGSMERNSVMLANAVGDVNNDGRDDVLLAGLLNDYQYHLFFGTSLLTNKTIDQDDVTISTSGSMCVYRYIVAGKNDVNGDGYDDIVMGCGYEGVAFEGRVYVFFGGPSFTDTSIAQADVTITAESEVIGFGNTVSTGDLNRDGIDDIIVSHSTRVYVFYGSKTLQNMTNTQANVTYSLDASKPSCSSFGYASFSEVNNDGITDTIVSSSSCGELYVFFGGTSPSSKNITQADLTFTAAAGMSFGNPTFTGNVNGDGYTDIVAAAGQYNNKQGRVYILTAPHGSSTLTVQNLHSTHELVATGNVTDTLGVGGVEVSVDQGEWRACTVTGTKYTCQLQSLNDGGHSLRIRSKNSSGIYIPINQYKQISFTFDHTVPETEWVDTSGMTQKFQSLGLANAYSTETLPSFAFVPSADNMSGLDKYQILINGEVAIDHISPLKPGDQSFRDENLMFIQYETNKITVRAKNEQARLLKGKAYKWKVRAVDWAGNVKDTDEKILRVSTHQINFSGKFFPLSLLSIGSKRTHISSLQYEKNPPPITLLQQRAVLFGIAQVNAKVHIKVTKPAPSGTSGISDEVVFESSVQTDMSSRFTLPLTKTLIPGKYHVLLSATNDFGDYAELPMIQLSVLASRVEAHEIYPKVLSSMDMVLPAVK